MLMIMPPPERWFESSPRNQFERDQRDGRHQQRRHAGQEDRAPSAAADETPLARDRDQLVMFWIAIRIRVTAGALSAVRRGVVHDRRVLSR